MLVPKSSGPGRAMSNLIFSPPRNEILRDFCLKSFFDTVNYSLLMERLARSITDRRVLRLIGRYLRVEVMLPDERWEPTPCRKLPPENFTPERMPFSATEQALNYHRLLLHMLAEVESLGFEVGVLVAGHYPLIDHTCAAVLQFNQRHRRGRDHSMLAGPWSITC